MQKINSGEFYTKLNELKAFKRRRERKESLLELFTCVCLLYETSLILTVIKCVSLIKV